MWNHYLLGSEPGDRVEADEPIAQIETDKVLSLVAFFLFSLLFLKLCQFH